MDLFINKLTEGTAIKATDYTVFDVANTTTGDFSTQKISYASFTKQLSSDISSNIKTLIDALQANINTLNSNLATKLDKKGLTYNSGERMTGTLYIPTLCATEIAHFNNNINLYNNFIQNVKDPVLDQDAVNKRTLLSAINTIPAISPNNFISKSGDVMTGGNLTLSAEPTISKHATTKFYVDSEITSVKTLITNGSNLLKNYVALSGGSGAIMTAGFITAPNTNPPTDDKHLSNKKYVDDQITTRTSNFVTTTTLGTTYVAKAGDTMTGALNLPIAAPTINTQAANKKYVDDQITTINNNLGNFITTTNAGATYVAKAGDTMTGALNLPIAAPTINTQAANKKYVDDQITTINNNLGNFITTTNAGATYVAKAGDTMTGSLALKGFSEKTGTSTATGNVTLNLSLGNTFPITLAGNITGFTLSNVPADSFSITIIITQAATGGPFTTNFTFAGYTVKWAGAATPVITTTANKTDIFCFTRVGTTIYAFNGGQNF